MLDLIARADVFAALHQPLVSGYALDALEHSPADPPSAEAVQKFVDTAVGARRVRRPSAGLGLDARFASLVCSGSALELDGSVVTLTAFPAEQTTPRVSRPSRRG